MKKLAIVALALVLAMTFVGCGAANLLVGTSWVQTWNGGKAILSFEKDNVCKYTVETTVGSTVTSSVLDGTWTADADQVTIKDVANQIDGVWTVEMSKDELTLTYVDKIAAANFHSTGDVEKMVREEK